ncbi:MAG: sugar transferase, partial [candidate division WOR-3 bacterium]
MSTLKRTIAITLLLVFDLASLAVCYVLAYQLRASIVPDLIPSLPALVDFRAFSNRYYLLAVYVTVFAYEGLYGRRLVLWEEIRRILRGTILATVLILMALYVTKGYVLSRAVVLLASTLCLLVIPLMRTLARRLTISLGLMLEPVVIIGLDRNAGLLKAELERNWRLGYRVKGNLDPSDPRLETPAGRSDMLRAFGATSFIVSDSSFDLRTPNHLENPGNEFILVINSSVLRSTNVEVEPLESLLLMRYRYNLLLPVNRIFKRILDLTIASLAFIILLPLGLFLALLVRLTSPGPVFFVQQRIGRGRRLFPCLKFRTMWLDAEERLPQVLSENPARRGEWTTYSRISNDPRITRFGRFLRRYSLDELPQLLNVLRGEMSLVGPRPYMPCETGKTGSSLDVITRVPPGITGPFQ